MVVPGPAASGSFLKSHDLARLALLAALAAGGYLAVQFTPLGAYFSRSFLVSFFDAIRMRWWSPLAFISLYAVSCSLAAPAALWTFVGGAVFGVVPGFLYNVIASNAGASIAFYTARFVSPDSLSSALKNTRLAGLSRRLEKNAVGAVFTLRLLLILPFNVVNILAGVSRIRYRDYAVGSLAGMLPATVVYTFLGDGIMAHLRMPRPVNLVRLAVLLASLAAASIVTWVFIKKRPGNPVPADEGRFPAGFLWGSATSSHQVEGNNTRNDWWEWEKKSPAADRSGLACDSFNRYEEDFDIARELGHNSHRFSIEWSRIEPEEGRWDEAAIAHYVRVVKALRSRGMEPVVTLHHFTNPLWLAAKGGWENPASAALFTRYAEKMAAALAPDVRYWVTINEPMVFIFHGYVIGYWPPGKKSVALSLRVIGNMARAHCASYEAIHGVYAKAGLSRPSVGLAHAVQALEPCTAAPGDKLAVFIRDTFNNRLFPKLVHHGAFYPAAHYFGTGGEKRCLDFLGVNYYFREFLKGRPLRAPLDMAGDVSKTDPRFLAAERSDLDWEIYPEGIYRVIQSVRRFGVPIMITENGICTGDEALRARYIASHLAWVRRAIGEGAPVIGYQYWSLLDNFEWAFGFKPRFGLVHVDYATQKRTVKESGRFYARICAENRLIPA